MSICEIKDAIHRIEIASPDSKIAVFRHKMVNGIRFYRVVFDNTIRTKIEIFENFKNDYIGSFDKEMNLRQVRTKIVKYRMR